MLQNYIKIGIRHLLRHKSFSIINILGLAIGIACCLLIILYVQDELDYDTFHDKGDRIYRVALDRHYPGRMTSYAIIPASYAEAMKMEYPEVVEATRMFDFPGNLVIKHNDQIFEEEDAIWADSTFFNVFSIPLIKGDIKTALVKPFSVVISEQTAQKYFGDEDPLGKTLDLVQGDNDLIVTGVCGNVPENSHLDFDMVQSSTALQFLEQPNFLSFSAYTYLLLSPNADAQALESKFPDLVIKFASGQVLNHFGVSYEQYQEDGNGYRYYLQPLPDIHLHSQLEGEIKPPGNATRVYIFGVIAAFILIIACINFMNLATARSMERAREVGIRKTLGSEKSQIAIQFLFEAITISFISTLLALLLLNYLIPLFNNLADKSFEMAQILSPSYLLMILGLAILVGFMAGAYPAAVLASFKPMAVLRGRFTSNRQGSWLRNGLVVFQFIVSVVLIISTIVVYNQMAYIQSKSLGFNKDHVVNLEGAGNLDGQQTETLKNKIKALPQVVSVGGCNSKPGGFFFGISFRPEGDNEMTTGRGLTIDENYIQCMEMEIADGRPFRDGSTDSTALVINESAVRALGIKDPVGKILTTKDQFLTPEDEEVGRFTIVGVVKDFHYQSLHQPIEPLFFVYHGLNNGAGDNIISVRLKTENYKETLTSIKGFWKEAMPDQPFTYNFLDEDLAALYDAEQRSKKVFGLFSLLAIFIACMGLLGLATYIIQQRTKEIGIRKVLGASMGNIVMELSKNFLKLVLVALVFASILAYFLMNSWLENFAYSISIKWWMFVLAGLIAVAIAFLTVSFQAIKAALGNPIHSLRSE